MNRPLSRTRCFSLCALVLALIIPLSARAAGPQDLAGKIISPDALLARADQLALTPAQRTEIERAQTARRATTAEALAKVRRASDALLEQLSQPKPDESAVLARFDELNTAEAALKRARLATTVRLMHLLTAAQLAQLSTATPSPAASASPATPRVTNAELLQQIRAGTQAWRQAGRDLTAIDALWARFRRHADAGEHPQARQTLQEMVTALSAPPATPSP